MLGKDVKLRLYLQYLPQTESFCPKWAAAEVLCTFSRGIINALCFIFASLNLVMPSTSALVDGETQREAVVVGLEVGCVP